MNSRVDQNELDLTENKAAISVNADHIHDLEVDGIKTILNIANFKFMNLKLKIFLLCQSDRSLPG